MVRLVRDEVGIGSGVSEGRVFGNIRNSNTSLTLLLIVDRDMSIHTIWLYSNLNDLFSV